MLERYQTFQPKPNTIDELKKVLQTIWDDKLFLQGFELLAIYDSLKYHISTFSYDFNTSTMVKIVIFIVIVLYGSVVV